MSEDQNNFSVVVFREGPKTAIHKEETESEHRVVTYTRVFELDKHEFYVCHFKDLFVYFIPEETKCSIEISLAQQSLWGASGPIAVFTLNEAAFIAQRVPERSFVFLSKQNSKDTLPTNGFMVRYQDWLDIRRYEDGTRSSVRDGYFMPNLCRALHIKSDYKKGDKKGDFTICPIVWEKSELASYKNRLFRLGTWQCDVWDTSAALIPDSELEFYTLKKTSSRPKLYPHLAEAVDKKDRARLLLSHLFMHWKMHDETLDNRAKDSRLFLDNISDKKNNFRNELVEAGCLNPSKGTAKDHLSRLKSEAKRALEKCTQEEIEEMKGGRLVKREYKDRRRRKTEFMDYTATVTDAAEALLAELYPEDFGRVLESSTLGPNVRNWCATARSLEIEAD